VLAASLPLGRFGWTLVVEESRADVFKPALVAVWQILGINLLAVVLFGGLAFWIAQSIVRPIAALASAARRIADGEPEVVIDPPDNETEIGVLVRAFNRMTVRLKRQRVELRESRAKIEDANTRLRGQNEELQRVNEVLEQLSITDGLTRLHNHRFFQEQLAREIARAERAGGPLTLVLIDIDNFKQLNDRYGHAVGDAVLCEVAKVMTRIVREADVLARYGGEEFALIPGQTDLEGAVGLAEKIRVAIAQSVVAIDDCGRRSTASVTVSIGVAEYEGDSRGLFNAADRALYRAKESGKDCVVVEGVDS
jgi:diguanylate cyclase (GGDEF)-like protein